MLKKLTAATLVSSLLLSAPGMPCWAAAGRVVPGAAAGSAPVAVRVDAIAPLANQLPSLPLVAAPASPAAAELPAMPSAASEPAPLSAADPSLESKSSGLQGSLARPEKAAAPAAGAPALAELLKDRASLSLTDDQAAAMPAAGAREAGAAIMDRVLGVEAAKAPADDGALASGSSSGPGALAPASGAGGSRAVPPAPPSFGPGAPSGGGRGAKAWGFVKSILRVGAGAGAVIGLHAGAVALLPSVFGVVPVAAVWAVSSGLFLFPAALYARHRLSLRDSPRLNKVRWLLDGAMGAYLGAVAIAVPSLGIALASGGATGAALGVAAGAGTLAALTSGGRISDIVFTGTALAGLPLIVALSGGGIIGLGPILGMLALPVMTTVAFFLGRLIRSAETGEPFTVPGTMQKIRFPAFNWVMTGVVFALTTGYGAVHSNIAFMIWMFLGNGKAPSWNKRAPLWSNLAALLLSFDTLYLGLLAATAVTGFTSPLTFLVLVFAPERAAVWAERLLGRFLPAAAAAPSTRPEPAARLAPAEPKPVRGLHWVKTFLLLGTMAAFGVALGGLVFGFASLAKNFAVAAVISAIPFFLSNWLIKKLMRAKPADPVHDAAFMKTMLELREKINAARAAKGQKPIPVPEMVNVPMPVPNAFATGRSPFKATVGVTDGFRDLVLDPENARRSLTVLMKASAENPDGKAFRAFRKAIARDIPGVTLDSTPESISQALGRADAAQLRALGERVLRGVLAHEFSHVMDRHMLSGAVGGAIASGIAFSSYGVMWAVGHAKTGLAKLKDGLLKRRSPGPTEKVTDLSKDPAQRGVKPEALEPITTGLVLKSLPALLKVFAALWGPIIAQILQLAGSRNNESQADFDGAALSDDPEALALGLGMLTTWRPPQGFAVLMREVPRLSAVSHLFTVNLLQQYHAAGALPAQQKGEVDWAFGRGDNFLLDLFTTHPDTGLRIERLFDLSESLDSRRGGPPPAAPPAGPGQGTGSLSPPQASLAPGGADAPTSGRGGPFRGAWERAKRALRVLPDKDRNAEFWKFTWGQALLSLGVNFHYTALPRLVAPAKEDSAKLGYNRAGNWGAQALASFATGPLIDRSSTQRVIVWTLLGRTLLLAAVPLLFFKGVLGFGAFLAVIFASGFLQSTGNTATSVAFNRILAGHESRFNRANAVMNLVMNLMGIAGPLAAGAFIALMDARLGALAGNALAYAVYALFTLGVAVLYGLTLRLPRDELREARQALVDRLMKGPGRDPRVRGVSGAREEGRSVLLVEVSGDPAEVSLEPDFEGFPVRVIARRRPLRELIEGMRLVWRHPFLRFYLLFNSAGLFIADSLMFALPRYLQDVLGRGAGTFGIYLAGASLGLGVSSLLMMRAGKDGLERQGRWSSYLHGLGWLAYWGVFFAPSMWLSVGALFLAMLLQGPGLIVWASLLQRHVTRDLPESMGKAISFMSFYQLALSIAGVLAFGWLMAALPTGAALLLVGVASTLAALADFIIPAVVFKRPNP